MGMRDRETGVDPASERLFTSATIITLVRTPIAAAPCLWAIHTRSLTWLVVGLVLYWIGDSIDGEVARWRNCESRIGSVMDMLCDRFNCACFYLGLAWLQPDMALPVAVYMFEFMTIDAFLSLAFLAWPIRSPNYFFVVDEKLWRWNWSRPGKAANSGAFAVLLLVTGWWWLGLVIALALLAMKCVSLARLLRIGLPVPPPRSRPVGGAVDGPVRGSVSA